MADSRRRARRGDLPDDEPQPKTPSVAPTPDDEVDPKGRNRPKAHDPEQATLTTSASARTRGAPQRAVPPSDTEEARPRTGRESVDGNLPSPITPKVQRAVNTQGDPVRVPDTGDIADGINARVTILDASAAILSIAGQHYRLDAQTLLALRRELDAAAIAVVS